jgi:YD repeat-containing protein
VVQKTQAANNAAVSRVAQFQYDAADNLVWTRDTNGVVTSYGYVALNQKTGTTLGADQPPAA